MTTGVVAAVGILLAWSLTVPLYRYKELRPLSRRDVSDEGAVVIRAVLRHARHPRSTVDAGMADVTPVVSWMLPGPGTGRRVPPSVIIFQVGLVVAMVLTAQRFERITLIVAYCWFALLAAVVSLVDARIWLIPWWMPWLGTAVGAVLLPVAALDMGEPERILWAAGSGGVAFALFFALFVAAPGKLGFGDVRLALPIGTFAGFVSPLVVLWALILGSLLGVVLGVLSLLAGRGRHFAFGPPLAVGTLLSIWLSNSVLAG